MCTCGANRALGGGGDGDVAGLRAGWAHALVSQSRPQMMRVEMADQLGSAGSRARLAALRRGDNAAGSESLALRRLCSPC